jgi:hypothetical protein
MPKSTYTRPSLSSSWTRVPYYILFWMAYSLTPSLAAPSATVTLSIFSYVPAYPPLDDRSYLPEPMDTCHPVHARVYGQFGNVQVLGEDSKPCLYSDQRRQCETNPLLQVLLKRLSSWASSIRSERTAILTTLTLPRKAFLTLPTRRVRVLSATCYPAYAAGAQLVA